MKVLFRGWTNIPHSYAVVNCFQLVHLYKKYKDVLTIYVEEMPYFRETWNNSKKLVYGEEYNEIIQGLKSYQGEPVDLIYSITYPYDITVTKTDNNKKVKKCVFFTSEFAWLDNKYFTPQMVNITQYLKDNTNLFFTSPSVWSSVGLNCFGVEQTRNRIITHGVDTSIFRFENCERHRLRKFYRVKENEILIINIGSMTQNKGIVQILEALNQLVNVRGHKEFKLLLKGTGDLYDSKTFMELYLQDLQGKGIITKEQTNNLITNHIIFTDKTLSYNRVCDLFNAADIYVSPYLAEGFNLTVLESLACGLPVLVPETGSTKEYIDDLYQNGGDKHIYRIPSKILRFSNGMHQNHIEVKDIVKTLEDAKGQLSVERCLNVQLQQYIKTNYSWNKVADLLWDYFQYIVKA